jgi:hypothetical protein
MITRVAPWTSLRHPSVKGILAVAGVGLSLAPESRASPPATSTCERGNPAGARQRGHDPRLQDNAWDSDLSFDQQGDRRPPVHRQRPWRCKGRV